jgi:hypothetical protein
VSAAVLAVDVRLLDGSLVGVPTILLVAAVGYTVGLAPFLVLTAYVLRVATESRLTLSAGPFILDTDRETRTTGSEPGGDDSRGTTRLFSRQRGPRSWPATPVPLPPLPRQARWPTNMPPGRIRTR